MTIIEFKLEDRKSSSALGTFSCGINHKAEGAGHRRMWSSECGDAQTPLAWLQLYAGEVRSTQYEGRYIFSWRLLLRRLVLVYAASES